MMSSPSKKPMLANVFLVIALLTGGILVGIFMAPLLHAEPVLNNNYKSVNFAPYLTYTHDCYIHADGCQAELPGHTFDYEIQSGEGSIFLTGTIITEENGFFAVNIPENHAYLILVITIINGTRYTAYTHFSTYDESGDCITSLQLLE